MVTKERQFDRASRSQGGSAHVKGCKQKSLWPCVVSPMAWRWGGGGSGRGGRPTKHPSYKGKTGKSDRSRSGLESVGGETDRTQQHSGRWNVKAESIEARGVTFEAQKKRKL